MAERDENGIDVNGMNLWNALTEIADIAQKLESKRIRIPAESHNAACGLREQAVWFQEAMENQYDWDTVGMEECIGYMRTNIQKMLDTAEHTLISECEQIHAQ